MTPDTLASGFFHQPTLDLARALLGQEVVHERDDGTTAGYIVEVEAYMGTSDKAAHSYTGRPTNRTQVMYGPAGKVYVFLVYGMHHCLNVVSGPVGSPEAILIRALQPTIGIDAMKRRREIRSTSVKDLTNGPGKLCQAMGITLEQYGWDFLTSPLYLRPGVTVAADDLAVGPRIGIDYAGEARSYPWRYCIRDNRFVSG